MRYGKKDPGNMPKGKNQDYPEGKNPDLNIPCLLDRVHKKPDDICAINKLGQFFREKNEFDKAREWFRKALSLNEKDEIALYGLADVLSQQGNYEESLNLTGKILSLNECNGWAHHNLGFMHDRQGNYQQAEKEYKRTLKLLPANVSAYNGLAGVLAKQGKITECIRVLEKVFEINSDVIETVKDIGNYLLDKVNAGQAEELIKRFSLMDPGNTALHRQLADIYVILKKYPQAVEIYQRIIDSGAADDALIKNLADVYNNQKQFDLAAPLYEQLLEKDPDNARLTMSLADIYNNQGLYSKSLLLYEVLVKKDPGNTAPHRQLADIYYHLKNYEEAIGIYKSILEINPDDIKALNRLGFIYRYQKNDESALLYYGKALEVDESSYEAHFGLGRLFLDNNLLLKAESAFKRALTSNPSYAHALHGLGDTYKQSNRYKEAGACYNMCKEADPYFLSAYIGLSDLFIKQRKFEEAAKELNAVLKMDPAHKAAKRELNWVIRQQKKYSLLLSGDSMKSARRESVEDVIKPRFCAIGVVRRCNFACKMCHIWEHKDKYELDAPQWKDFLIKFKKVADDHCQINFAGGEPFLKTDLMEINNFARKQGFITAICSNGYFINENMAHKINDSGLNTIALSLDSLNPARHNFLRGTKDACERVMSSIDLLKKHSPKTEINLLTIILQENLQDIIPLSEWAQSDKRINMINFLALIQPRGNRQDILWHTRPEYNILWPQDINELDRVIDKLIDMKSNGFFKIGNPVSQLLKFKQYYHDPNRYIHEYIKCSMGYLFLSVNEKGYVTLCEEKDPIGNILEQDIYDIWFSEKAYEVREQIRGCRQNCHQLINCCYEEETPAAMDGHCTEKTP
jgi:tetratricopeptide (TPR) repeat protein